VYDALDFGAHARYVAHWARAWAPSGIPTSCTALEAAIATWRACGAALPMSSLARMTMRRAMKRGSSPASSITAR